MSNLLKFRHDGGWSAVPNKMLEDSKLSWRAKGLWSYLYSRPDDWEVKEQDLIARSTDGRHVVRATLDELESAGYLTRTQVRERGQYSTTTYAMHLPGEGPSTEEPSTGEPTTVEPTTVDRPLTNTEENKKEKNNTEHDRVQLVRDAAHWLAVYPDRPEPHPQAAFTKQYIRQRELGASERELLDAAINYKHWCKENNRLGTRYIFSAMSFITTHWNEWVDRKPVSDTVVASNGLRYLR